ncbi:hypothetical protein EVA_03776 [gut metagenome]|uniref:Uncharacterized protein n=1 Tax=gut metagenome TaxID=749906 RepID=J9D5Z0_9ZZZZ
MSTHGKNIKNQRSTIQNFNFQFSFNIPYLLGRKFIIEDHHTHFPFCFFFIPDILLNFFQFTLTYISYRIGLIQLLRKSFHHFRPSCLSQEG